MQSVKVNGAKLEYEAVGSGEPVLLISPVLADGFLPLFEEPVLADRYKLIRYHKRGWAGSTHTPAPVSIADHATTSVSDASTSQATPAARRLPPSWHSTIPRACTR